MRVQSHSRRTLQLLLLIVFVQGLIGCQNSSVENTKESPEQQIYAEVVFSMKVPTVDKSDIFIEVLDEVSGLALNPSRYKLESQADNTYQITLPFPVGSMLKYRYVKGQSPAQIEYNAQNKQVRYRVLIVNGNTQIDDIVTSWTGEQYLGLTGRITGIVMDPENRPVGNVLITTGGAQTFSSTDGSFVIDGIIPGTHSLLAMAIDGSYQPFEQGAKVEAGATTPVEITMVPSNYIDVTFIVTPPAQTAGLPIRLVGNLPILGNTYSDLYSGSSVLASRAPLLSYQPDGNYSIKLRLPVGFDLRYRFTLGDGYWNTEHAANGKITERQLIIPAEDQDEVDLIERWSSSDAPPVSITVTVPETTPVTDTISIQFNLFGWSTPIPMWSLGNNQWYYHFYNAFDNISYRYCRNDLCGIADDITTSGGGTSGKQIQKDQTTINDVVNEWQWWSPDTVSATIKADAINPRGSDFIGGVEFQPAYHPSWKPHFTSAIKNINDIGANWIVLPIIEAYSEIDLPVIEAGQSLNMQLADLGATIEMTNNIDLQVAVYPITWVDDTADFWNQVDLSAGWWDTWFDQYQKVLRSGAIIASKYNLPMLIIGEPYLTPAITGVLPDGETSNLPDDSDERWMSILDELNGIYDGDIYWAVQYDNGLPILPSGVNKVDGLYLLWNTSYSIVSSDPLTEITNQTTQKLDTDIKPLYDQYQFPIVIAVEFSSTPNGYEGCNQLSEKDCLTNRELGQPQPDTVRNYPIDFQAQVDAYTAVLSAINQRPWIAGFVSRGYYPPALLQDGSSSIHGKPAADVLWYWYPRLLSE